MSMFNKCVMCIHSMSVQLKIFAGNSPFLCNPHKEKWARAKTLLLFGTKQGLVNKELIFPVFSIKFVKFGFKLEENNEKYIFGIFKLFAFIQDLIKLIWFSHSQMKVLVYKNPPYQ